MHATAVAPPTYTVPAGRKTVSVSFIVEWANTVYNGVPRFFRFLDILTRQWQELLDGRYPANLEPGLGEKIRRCAPLFRLSSIVGEGLEYYALKNLGAEHATGQIICFLDSDINPDPGWLTHLLGSFSDHRVDAVAGRPYVAPVDLMSRAFSLGWTYAFLDQRGGLSIPEKFYSNNLAFRTQVFAKAPFPDLQRRTRGACSLLGERMAELGHPVWQNGEALVDHPAPSGWKHLAVRALAHGRDMYMKFSEERSFRGLVTLKAWPQPFHLGAQRSAYQHCLAAARHRTRWLAFIDLDEFLFAPRDHHPGRALRDYERWPGVVVHWQNYGSAGHRVRADAPVIERFTRRARRSWIRNRKVKSIVDPTRTTAPLGVHHFAYAEGALPVDETGRAVRIRPRSPNRKRFKPWYGRLGPLLRFTDPYCSAGIDNRRVCVERLRINHYPVKSLEEFRAKSTLKREKRRYEDIDYFAYHDRNEVDDPVLYRYLPDLRERLRATSDRTALFENTVWKSQH